MSWSGGTYRKGNYLTNGWTGDASLGIGIEAGRHDTQDDDFANGINNCLTKDGQNTSTANLPMGGFKHTNVGNGSARNDYAALGQVQDQTASYLGTTGGTSTAFTVTGTPTITTLVTGARYIFKANAANGAAATLKIDATAATAMQRQGTALAGNEFKANDIIEVVYDGANFQITNIATAPLFVDRTNARVGIGTNAPTVDLEIQSVVGSETTTRFSNDVNGPELQFRKSRGASVGTNTIVQSTDTLGLISFYGANGTGYDRAAYFGAIVNATPGASGDMPGALVFGTAADGTSGGSERMRIANTGFVGIGGGGNPAYLFTVSSSVAANTAASFSTGGAGDATTIAAQIIKTDATNTAGANNFLGFYIAGGATGSGKISSNGASAAAFFTLSDVTLKENIVDLPSQLNNILGLRPVEFDYKDGSGHQIGFIAQDVEQVYPDNVHTDADGIKSIGDMSRMDARIIKAIQDLNAKVDALEARVAELEK